MWFGTILPLSSGGFRILGAFPFSNKSEIFFFFFFFFFLI